MTTIHLPYVGNGPTVPDEVNVKSVEQLLFERMRDHPEQGRGELIWNDTLAHVAHSKCYQQALHGWTGHVSPSGQGPNRWVRDAGYRLPSHYSQADDANNIESLCHGGDGEVEGVWQVWMGSEGHRVHLLGSIDFYARQVCVGIGHHYLDSSKYNHYWAVITAPEEE